MSDCSLNAACSGLILLRNGRIEDLGDTVDDVTVLDGEEDSRAEILVALDMCRYTDLVNDASDLRLYVGRVIVGLVFLGFGKLCLLIAVFQGKQRSCFVW